MYSINNHYHSLGKSDKELFREKIMKELNIKKKTFYIWLLRDSIPKKMQEQFAKLIGIEKLN